MFIWALFQYQIRLLDVSLQSARFVFRIVRSLWNLAGTSMTLEIAWRTRPLQLVLNGGPVTPTPIREYNGLRGENRGPFKGQQASASNPVMSARVLPKCLSNFKAMRWLNCQSRGFETCTKRRLLGYWNGALVFIEGLDKQGSSISLATAAVSSNVKGCYISNIFSLWQTLAKLTYRFLVFREYDKIEIVSAQKSWQIDETHKWFFTCRKLGLRSECPLWGDGSFGDVVKVLMIPVGIHSGSTGL